MDNIFEKYEFNNEKIFKNLDDEFFIVDSRHLDSVNSKLYGFTLIGAEIIQNENMDANFTPSPVGAYVFVKKTGDKIIISQDFNGSYGIYLYENENEFIISNSFFKLVNYVKEDYTITLNKEYADAFIAADFCSLIYEETLVNEIRLLPKNYELSIEIPSKKINFNEINYNENTISLDSKEGMDILDSWFNRWIKIIRSIKKRSNNFTFDLSGGFDSRLMLTLMLSSNINLNDIHINSINDSRHEEDYEIASSIADTFGFELNREIKTNKQDTTMSNMILNSFYTKLGVHKQFYFRYFYNIDPEYNFTGYGGECLRFHWRFTVEEFISLFSNKGRVKSEKLSKPTQNILERSFSKLNENPNFRNNPIGLPDVSFREVLCVNHFGRGTVENYLINSFNLSPLLDPDLHKLRLNDDNCDDKNLLISVIFSRYCPKLLEFKIEKNRNIEQSTIEYAKKLNEKYPFKKINLEYITTHNNTPNVNEKNTERKIVPRGEPNKLLTQVFLSKEFKKKFEQIYPADLYQKIVNIIRNLNYSTTEDIYVAFSAIYVLDAVEYSFNKHKPNLFEWMGNFLTNNNSKKETELGDISTYMTKYNTARIDIKNIGSEDNSIEIINISDSSSKIEYPNWFKNQNGKGLVIQSSKNHLDMEMKCIGDGKLTISLKGIEYKNLSGQKIPIYINFTKFLINDEDLNLNNELVWCDIPYYHNKLVKNGEIIKIHIEWTPI